MPAISVLMTVYNGESFLSDAIKSILNQTFNDFEFIIVDNASTDSSVKIIESFVDSRIRLVKNISNQGQTKALNIGLRVSRGRYIARIDADDVARAHRLETQFNFLEKQTKYSVVGSHVCLIDSRGAQWHTLYFPVNYEDITWVALHASPVAHSAVLMRSSVILELGGYDESFVITQDYALWTALIGKGHHITNFDNVLTCLRVHPGQLSRGDAQSKLVNETTRLIRKNVASQLNIYASDEETKGLFCLLRHSASVSSYPIETSLKLFYRISSVFKYRVNQNSFFYVKTLVRLAILRKELPFLVRGKILFRAVFSLFFTKNAYSAAFFICRWIFTGKFFGALRMELWRRRRQDLGKHLSELQ